MTITVQLGNSDDKLTQVEWSEFVQRAFALVTSWSNNNIHFFGASTNYAKWQNVCFVIVCTEHNASVLRKQLSILRQEFKQDSIAWLEGETQFI